MRRDQHVGQFMERAPRRPPIRLGLGGILPPYIERGAAEVAIPSPVTDPAPAETVFPLAEIDRMLPLCDTVLIACAFATPATVSTANVVTDWDATVGIVQSGTGPPPPLGFRTMAIP